MNVSRRLLIWRLVAMVMVVLALAAGTAIAQTEQVRVKFGPANVYERPRTSSDVILVAKDGMLLDVLKREDTWYWVVLPPDANGTRRDGYIAAYLVERVGRPGVVEAGIAGAPAAHPPVPVATRPDKASSTAAGLPRYFVGIGGGAQTASQAFSDSVVFPLYDESGQYHASYATGKSSALDATIGVRLAPHFVLAVALWRSTSLPAATIGASVPHPFTYNTPRAATAEGFVVGRAEDDGHLQVTWLVPVARRVDVAIFGGPSLFYLRQDVISGLSFRETYPYDTVAIAGFQTARRSKMGIGGHAGVDVTVMALRYIGVGVSARYARGSLTLPAADSGSIDVQVGGAQVSGGLRLRF
jgi:hypothetical protein